MIKIDKEDLIPIEYKKCSESSTEDHTESLSFFYEGIRVCAFRKNPFNRNEVELWPINAQDKIPGSIGAGMCLMVELPVEDLPLNFKP